MVPSRQPARRGATVIFRGPVQPRSSQKLLRMAIVRLEGSRQLVCRTCGEDVTAAALILHFRRVGIALQGFLNLEARCPTIATHFVGREEGQVEADRVPEHLFVVAIFRAKMKRNEEGSTGAENPANFAESRPHLRARNVNDGVEGGHSGKRLRPEAEGQHRALYKIGIRIEAASLGQHSCGKIQSERVDSTIAQVAGNLRRTATQIANLSPATKPFGEEVKRVAIEGLAGELAVNLVGVCARNSVVALPGADRTQLGILRIEGWGHVSS